MGDTEPDIIDLIVERRSKGFAILYFNEHAWMMPDGTECPQGLTFDEMVVWVNATIRERQRIENAALTSPDTPAAKAP